MRIHAIVATLCFCVYSIAAPTSTVVRFESSPDLDQKREAGPLSDISSLDAVPLSGTFRRDAIPLADTFRRDAEPLADTFKRDAEPLADTFKYSRSLDRSDFNQYIQAVDIP